jgi:hypothetical protein
VLNHRGHVRLSIAGGSRGDGAQRAGWLRVIGGSHGRLDPCGSNWMGLDLFCDLIDDLD